MSQPKCGFWKPPHIRKLFSRHDNTPGYGDLPTPTSTRVLTLYPDGDDKPLRGKLRNVDLDVEVVDYIALSYAWGSLEKSEAIKIDFGHGSTSVPITANLFSLLRRLRRGFTYQGQRRIQNRSRIWVDALCINQGKDEEALRERAFQVQRMNVIFSKADSVIVDLGELPVHWEEFCSVVERTRTVSNHTLMNEFEMIAPIYADLEESSPAWSVLDDILQRKYWKRIWCFQEFLLAKTPYFSLGDVLLNETFLAECETFCMFQKRLIEINGWSARYSSFVTQGPAWVALQVLLKFRADYTNNLLRHFSICELFSRVRFYLEASDPRDRFYALYGIAQWDLLEPPELSYLKPTRSLSLEVSKMFVQHGEIRSLLCISNCSRSDLPSWGFDLSQLHRQGYYDRESDESNYYASGSTTTAASLCTDSTTLEISACILENVTTLAGKSLVSIIKSSYNPDKNDVAFVKTLLMRWSESVRTWAASLLQHLQEDEITDILCHTMIADLDRERRRAGPHLIAAYNRWQKNPPAWPSVDVQNFDPLAMVFEESLWSKSNQLLAGTNNKRLALVSDNTEINNKICIFPGVEIPFVIRQYADGGKDHYKLVGQCYLHGMMDGQALDRDDWKLSNIFLD